MSNIALLIIIAVLQSVFILLLSTHNFLHTPPEIPHLQSYSNFHFLNLYILPHNITRTEFGPLPLNTVCNTWRRILYTLVSMVPKWIQPLLTSLTVFPILNMFFLMLGLFREWPNLLKVQARQILRYFALIFTTVLGSLLLTIWEWPFPIVTTIDQSIICYFCCTFPSYPILWTFISSYSLRI